MLFIDTVVDAAVGASVDAATTTAGTAVVASTEMAFATTAVTLLKVAVLKTSTAASANMIATSLLGKVAYNVCYNAVTTDASTHSDVMVTGVITAAGHQ